MKRILNMKFFYALLVVSTLFAVFTAMGRDADFRFVSLENAANRGFLDETAGDGKGGWFDQGPVNDMSGFTSGIRNFSGVPFRIIDPAANHGRSCVVLRGRGQKALPLDTGAIAVNEKAEAVLFLSSCGWNAGIGETVATVTVRFRRAGLYLEIPLRYQMETGPWWNPETPMRGEIAWKGRNRSADIGIYISGWVNPYPDEEIESITISSPNGSALPVILAVTLTNDAKTVAVWKERNREKNASAAGAATGPVRISTPEPAVKGIPVSGKLASLSLGFNRNEPYRRAAAHLTEVGRKKPFIRLQINIAEPSPAEGVWDFSKLDEYVDFIQSAGAEPMLCFGPGGPIWMADPNVPGTMSANWRPRIREEYYTYCEAILRRYTVERKQPVLWWQIGNETELKGWSYRYYSEIYRELAPRLRRIMPEIRAAAPDVVILFWHNGLYSSIGSMGNFLRRFPEIDLVVGGHSHQEHPGERAGHVHFVQTGRFAEAAGRIRITLDDRTRRILRIDSELLRPGTLPDPEVAAAQRPFRSSFDRYASEQVITFPEPVEFPAEIIWNHPFSRLAAAAVDRAQRHCRRTGRLCLRRRRLCDQAFRAGNPVLTHRSAVAALRTQGQCGKPAAMRRYCAGRSAPACDPPGAGSAVGLPRIPSACVADAEQRPNTDPTAAAQRTVGPKRPVCQ